MNLCSSGHEEICYEGRVCPLCFTIESLNKVIDARDNEISDLESSVKGLDDEVAALSSDNAALKDDINELERAAADDLREIRTAITILQNNEDED